MSARLSPTLAERQAYPWAVGVRRTGDGQTEYLHFATEGAASLFAHLLDGGANAEVTRWAALTEPEWMSHAIVPGWRQVSYFLCDRQACRVCGNEGTVRDFPTTHTCEGAAAR